ncbi:MAG: hypothetical protein KF749_02930 [Bacteroidetes bacterium]|nr:hypothetical protein [Bacteroidota bacterium]MCW5896770.1 hypothetical protein [Bacteroidota bacterium]
MKHIDEIILERYLRAPDTLHEDEVAATREHLQSCPVCLKALEFLQSFYSEVEARPYVRTPKAAAFVHSIFPVSGVVPLRPLVYKPGPRAVPSGFTTVLAADTAIEHRFESFALHSEEESIVARILYDKTHGTYKLYVLTDDVRKREYGIVVFPELAVECVTDMQGFAEFKVPATYRTKEVAGMPALLYTAAAHFEYSKEDVVNHEGHSRSSEADFTLSVHYDGATLHLNAQSASEKEITRALITDGSGRALLIPLKNGAGTCTMASIPDTLAIRLYC